MKSLADIAAGITLVTGEHTLSERNFILRDMYQLYENEREKRKKENWVRYIYFLKQVKIKDSKEMQAKFRKQPLFIKEFTPKTFAIKLSHLKITDLYYCLSEMKDTNRRGGSGSAWLFKSIKA